MAWPRGRPNNPPNRNARLAYRRWKVQRDRERMMPEYTPDLIAIAEHLELPLPGRPWWRSKWAQSGVTVPDLPMTRCQPKELAQLAANKRTVRRLKRGGSASIRVLRPRS